MSYRSFCSVVLRPGAGPEEDESNDTALASSVTKMTSIVQITSDDVTDQHLGDDFFDHHRDDFFSRKDDEFVTQRRGQQQTMVIDDVVTCEDASSTTVTQAVDGSEEQALDGVIWSNGRGKVATEHSISESVIQVVRDCDAGTVSEASSGGGQEKSSLSRPGTEAISAISVKENQAQECASAIVAVTSASSAAAVVPVKTSGGNNTTKVYLNAEEIENSSSVIEESVACLNILKAGEPAEEVSPSDEKGEVSETESDTKTETSETESETKTSNVVESVTGTRVLLESVHNEKIIVSEVTESDEQLHLTDAPLSPPLSLDSSNQESILDSLDTVDTAISEGLSVVKSQHSIVLDVNPQTLADQTETVEGDMKNTGAKSDTDTGTVLVGTSQFMQVISDARDMTIDGALSPATLDFEAEDSAPASLSTAEDTIVEKMTKVQEIVEQATHSTAEEMQNESKSIEGGLVSTQFTDKREEISSVVVQQILNLNSKQEFTSSTEVVNSSEIKEGNNISKDSAVAKMGSSSKSSEEKAVGDDRPSVPELDLPLLTKSVKELAAEIAQAESGSKSVPAPASPRNGDVGSQAPVKQQTQVVVPKPRLSKIVSPSTDPKSTSTIATQDVLQSDIVVVATKESSMTVAQNIQVLEASVQSNVVPKVAGENTAVSKVSPEPNAVLKVSAETNAMPTVSAETSAVSKVSAELLVASAAAEALPVPPSPTLVVSLAADVGPSPASDEEASESVTVIKRSFTSIQLKEGEVDEASILSAKGATKQYWEDRMMAAAVPAEEGGWEPVGNVCFRDPNAPADSSDEQSEEGSSSAQDIIPAPEFLPAPPPQFDNSPPASIEEPSPSLAVKSQASFPALQNYEDLQKASVEITTKDEKLINLDEEISTLEREVLGEDVEEEEEAEMVELMGEREMEDVSKPNLQYVYGEEGSGPVKKPQQQQVQRRGGEPNRIPTVKGTLTAAQIKENVIEAEIRAQQKRERELQQEQVKKQQLMMNLHNSQKSDDILRKKGASSPQDSDEGFVDPPVERSSTVGGQAADVDTKAGFTHAIPGADGESVIYDAVSPAPVNGHLQRSAPVPATRASVPATTGPKVRSVAPAPAPVASNTTETKIALEIRELKEREEELRKMRDARLAAKRTSSHNTTASGAEADDEFVPEEQDMDEDAEDRGSSSSRELLDDHLASLTTTTDEGNFSECGDATSSEDKSSNGSNSRIMSPEVPATEYPRPPRRVTVRPYQDEEEDQPVYTRMKNESVIEREIRMAKERDEAFKKEKGLIMNGAAIKGSNGLTNGKHATLRQSASMSAIATQQNGPRDTQQHMATSRIQLEIAESSQRERELLTVGKVLTLSEDTVDNKVTRLSDLSELPSAQVETQVRTKSPTSSSASTRSISSASGGGSSRQSPNASPHSTLTSAGRLPQQNGHHTINGHLTNGFSNGLSNGHHFNSLTNGGSARLTRSLSTTNLSSPSSLTTVNGGGGAGLRPPKGFMEKFIASRGKMTPSAFSSPPPMGGGSGRVVATRPMRVQPKAPVVLRQQATDNTPTKDDEAGKLSTASVTSSTAATVAETKVNGVVKSEQKSEGKSPTPQAPYKRFIGAEEKIQEELRDMQQREEELRQLRSRNMARSQPNLLEMGLSEISFEEEPQNGIEEEHGEEEVETGIRSAVSNPNLLEDGPDAKTLKNLRRRSTLIAEWENRIQATTVADA